MQTDDLIARLADDLTPVRRGAVARALAVPLLVGLVAAGLAMLGWLGPRPDLVPAMGTFPFWMKFFYTLAVAGLALWLVERTGRPGAPWRRPLVLMALPLAILVLLAALALATPGADTHALMMGVSSQVCARNILVISLPLLAGAFWALRRLAPTRPALAGAGAGLFAGAAGAFVYAFHCTESAAPFVAIWYTLGMLLPALLGGFLGRWALRW